MLLSSAAPAASRPAFWAPARAGRQQTVRTQALFGGLLQKMGNGGAASNTAAAKEELLEAVAPLKRGLTATADDKARIDKLASALERRNPTKKPLASDLINGQWELMYTTSESILGTNKPALLRPRGPIYQIIGACCRWAGISGLPAWRDRVKWIQSIDGRCHSSAIGCAQKRRPACLPTQHASSCLPDCSPVCVFGPCCRRGGAQGAQQGGAPAVQRGQRGAHPAVRQQGQGPVQGVQAAGPDPRQGAALCHRRAGHHLPGRRAAHLPGQPQQPVHPQDAESQRQALKRAVAAASTACHNGFMLTARAQHGTI